MEENKRLGKHVDDDELEMIQFKPVVEEDETEQRKNKAVRHLNKLKNYRKIFIITILVIVLIIAIIYFVSPISKVNDINIVGNNYFSDKTIINMTNLDYGDYMIDVSIDKIEKDIKKKDPLIKKVKVTKKFGGTININLDVERVVAYYGSGKDVKVLKSNGEDVTVKNDDIDKTKIPYVSNMRESEYKIIAKELKALSDTQLGMISEIRPYKNSYGVKMVELIMNDGHIVRTEIDGIHLVKSYNKIIEKLNSNLRCINIIEGTKSAYSEKC